MIKRESKVLEEEDIEIAKNKLQFGKKQTKILDEKQKEILSIYQASKAFVCKSKVALFDEGVSKLETTYPSYNELIENIRRYLAGNIGVEVIKKEQYAVNSEDLKHAMKIASSMVEKYKMANDANELINRVKNELRAELSHNAIEINRLKDIMIKNEVISENDF